VENDWSEKVLVKMRRVFDVILLWFFSMAVYADPASFGEYEVDPLVREIVEKSLGKEVEIRKECQAYVELWRVDIERGVGRWEAGDLRPWSSAVMLQVDGLVDAVRLVEDPQVRMTILDKVEAYNKKVCESSKRFLQHSMSIIGR